MGHAMVALLVTSLCGLASANNWHTKWTMHATKTCAPPYLTGPGDTQSYTKLEAAKVACMIDPKCTGVVDTACDNAGYFSLCTTAVGSWATDASNCVYQKVT